MMGQNYQLDGAILRATEAITLWQSERGIVKIDENTLAISIKLDDHKKGYIFHGNGKLILDTIVETEEGAIGKPVEKEIDKLFLMLGDAEKVHPYLKTTSKEDLNKMGYKDQKEFVAKAEDLCNRFFRERVHSRQGLDEGLIFAFQNESHKFDILVANGSKLVYKATGIAFVSNEHKVVLKSPSEVVCSNNGKMAIVKKACRL